MTKFVLSIALLATGVAAATLFLLHFPRARAEVQRAVTPGDLSQAHAFLQNNCAACHTPVKGIEAKNCIVCHADNQNLLQRQPSAFHATIGECTSCHVEHLGHDNRPVTMDHVALAQIAERKIIAETKNSVGTKSGTDLVAWIRSRPQNIGDLPNFPHVTPAESGLNCNECHSSKDPHRELFGTDCASCHATTKWTLPEFRHPSPASQSCAQCHQAPPSHYMMHFKMVSMTIAHVEKAEVNQCFLCHQTTSWNDIKGVGFYKHH